MNPRWPIERGDEIRDTPWSVTLGVQRKLDLLFDDIGDCHRCAGMPGRPKTLGPWSGDPASRCLVIATAPGAHKVDPEAEQKPLTGDRAGEAFHKLLEGASLKRSSFFLTNAVLCTPRTKSGRGRRPRLEEIRNCNRYLSRLVTYLDPALIVTLGTTALSALSELAPHDLSLSADCGRPTRWMARWLLPLYHPGPRAMIHRSWADQQRDYALWRSLLES
jgi:uracil-DNA glycosylase family 4